jgi:preprotein translocase subunit Sec63
LLQLLYKIKNAAVITALALTCLPFDAQTSQEPSKAIVEMQQCIAQAMSISIRKPQGKPADPTTLLLQLPRVDMDVAKKLRRRKIQTLKGQCRYG